jgi:hypothetical protein
MCAAAFALPLPCSPEPWDSRILNELAVCCTDERGPSDELAGQETIASSFKPRLAPAVYDASLFDPL